MLRHARTPQAFLQSLAAEWLSPSAAAQCHAEATKLGYAANVFVSTALLKLYCRSHGLQEAQRLFDEMPHRSAVTWSTLIYGHARYGGPGFAIWTFRRMLCNGVFPIKSAMSSALVACAKLDDAGIGAMLHCVGLRCGVSDDIVVGTALVNMYAKCHHLCVAHKVLEEMEEKNVTTFTALIGGFAVDGRSHDAMLLLKEMEQSGVAPNVMTYSSLLSSFHSPDDINHARQVHCAVRKKGLEDNPYVLASMLTMYSKCDSLEDFRNVQVAVSCQDQVSYNSVISGLSCLGRGDEAFQHFLQMRRRGVHTDVFTFASMLKATGSSSTLLEGTQLHALILKTGYVHDINVQNGLISMYSRCGEIVEAKAVFTSMEAPDLVSWNSLLSGCAQHGYGTEVIELFEQMKRLKVQPDHTTFLSLLKVCSHVGLVDKGLEFFNLIKEKGSLAGARLQHYACMVDLLGRAGYLLEAESLMNDMPMKPGLSVYRAVLSSCQIHGNLEIAIRVSKRLTELYPHDPSARVQLSKAFAGDGRWDNAAEIRETMKDKGVVKVPAWSCIEDRMRSGRL
jgi:pentatricopeptide repeat protein